MIRCRVPMEKITEITEITETARRPSGLIF